MTTIPFSQLITPTPSGVSPGVTVATVPANTWLAFILANGNTLNLAATSWQSGGIAWTQEQIFAEMLAALEGGTVSIAAQGGFLDFAATGTVTYVNAQGLTVTVPVTPDPSIPAQNPTGALGWLDTLASSVYNVKRQTATYAGGVLYFVNTTTSSAGTYGIGNFHAANTFNGATYKNTASFTASTSTSVGTSVATVSYGSTVVLGMSSGHGLTVGSFVVVYVSDVPGLSSNWANAFVLDVSRLSLTGVAGSGTYVSGGAVWIPQQVPFTADLIGPGSNAAPGQISTTVTSVPGCFVSNVILPFTGSAWQSNVSLTALCRAQLQAVSPNGAKGAYLVYALQAATLLGAQSTPKTLTQAITRAVPSNNTATGAVTTTVANATGPVPGVTNLLVIGMTGNGVNPIVVQVATTTGLTTGMNAIVSGVNGNPAANGYWPITVVDGSHFSIPTTGNGAWTTGGVVEAGDLGLVDSILQAYATPNAVTELTQSAASLTVNITASIFIPSAFVVDFGSSSTANKAVTSLVAYLPNIPIGGEILPGNSGGVVDISAIEDLIFNSGQTAGQVYTLSVQNLLINGQPQSLAMTTSQVAVAGTLSIQVVPV